MHTKKYLMNITVIAKALALCTTGLLAGTFYYATFNVLPTFSEVPDSVHLAFRTALMKHNAVTMQLLMASSVLAGGWLAWQVRHNRRALCWVIPSCLLAVTCFLVTRLGNVPINMLIKTWSPEHPPHDWQNTLARWNLFHTMRAYAAMGSFLSLVIADSVWNKRVEDNTK
jgi:uncharacterized membrane protein